MHNDPIKADAEGMAGRPASGTDWFRIADGYDSALRTISDLVGLGYGLAVDQMTSCKDDSGRPCFRMPAGTADRVLSLLRAAEDVATRALEGGR